MASWDADILWTHKYNNWVSKDKASGMLPFNWFPERLLNIRKKEKLVLSIIVDMDMATDDY